MVLQSSLRQTQTVMIESNHHTRGAVLNSGKLLWQNRMEIIRFSYIFYRISAQSAELVDVNEQYFVCNEK